MVGSWTVWSPLKGIIEIVSSSPRVVCRRGCCNELLFWSSLSGSFSHVGEARCYHDSDHDCLAYPGEAGHEYGVSSVGSLANAGEAYYVDCFDDSAGDHHDDDFEGFDDAPSVLPAGFVAVVHAPGCVAAIDEDDAVGHCANDECSDDDDDFLSSCAGNCSGEDPGADVASCADYFYVGSSCYYSGFCSISRSCADHSGEDSGCDDPYDVGYTEHSDPDYDVYSSGCDTVDYTYASSCADDSDPGSYAVGHSSKYSDPTGRCSPGA